MCFKPNTKMQILANGALKFRKNPDQRKKFQSITFLLALRLDWSHGYTNSAENI